MNLNESVATWKRKQEAINAHREEAARLRSQAEDESNAADAALIDVFIDAYCALPRAVRMKIRNRVNKEVTT